MLWLIAAILQCVALYVIWRMTRKTILSQHDEITINIPENAPSVAMIIPAAGKHPAMQEALTSLLNQDYENIIPVIVTASEDDPATTLARSLQESFPKLECVIAGEAKQCAQKNHNSLQALAHVGARAEIYAFCDSTHMAKPNFIKHLVAPIINGEAGFTTGYHEVKALDEKPVSLAYQFSVLLMRMLQAVSVFTQPWGGGMAIARNVFEQHQIADIWSNNVVDDCSLAGMLIKRRLHVKLCPQAILSTKAENHDFNVWQAWMQRQVLFLKFCVISQWYLLGIFAAILALPVLISCIIIFAGLINVLASQYAWYSLLAIAHIIILSLIVLNLRELLPRKTSPKSWLLAFFLGINMFAWVYINTIRAWHIDWHGIRYHVASGGKLLSMEKIS